MKTTITKEVFEAFCPTFRSPAADQATFEKIRPYVEEAEKELRALAGDYADATDDTTAALLRSACLRGAYLAVPNIDLILTPNGFGVVSNANQAPASKERVAALREQLRADGSDAHDTLIFALLKTEWANTDAAKHVCHDLFFCPMTARGYGITFQDRKTYAEEWQQLAPYLAGAYTKIRRIISPELYTVVCDYLRLKGVSKDYPTATADILDTIARKAMRCVAAHLVNDKYPKAAKMLDLELIDYVNQNAATLPAYTGSSTYSAQNFERYENKQEDATFFF